MSFVHSDMLNLFVAPIVLSFLFVCYNFAKKNNQKLTNLAYQPIHGYKLPYILFYMLAFMIEYINVYIEIFK